MLKLNDAMVATLMTGSRATAERLLKNASGVVPFGIVLGVDGNVADVVFAGGDAVLQSADGGTCALLMHETILNAEMRRRACAPGVGAISLATQRDIASGKLLCVQMEFESATVVIAVPYQKKLFGWAFGEMMVVNDTVFVPPQEGQAPAPVEDGPFGNAFAPSARGDALFHRHSGFRFPTRVGEFEAGNPFQYDAHGQDASHAYQHAKLAELAVTTYVYPVPPGAAGSALAEQFGKCKDDLAGMHKAVKPVFEDEVRLHIGGQQRTGRQGVFRLKTEFQGATVESLSEIWLFVHGGFFLKYRASYPPELKTRAPGAVRQLVSDLVWP